MQEVEAAGASLLPAVLEQAPQMSFFRFCELMELSAPQRAPLDATDSPAHEPIRFRSRAGLGFPGREMDAVERDADNPLGTPSIRTTFLGLYGVDARMPAYFADEVAMNRDGASPLSAFLDIFHHRIATQFYRVWRKYRYPVGFRSDGSDDTSSYLLSLAGLGIGASVTQERVGVRRLLSMLGPAGQKTRTAEGLTGVLSQIVPDADVEVQECYPVWIVPDAIEPAPLGHGCLLGRGFNDRANAVRVVFKPQTEAAMNALMPGQEEHRQLLVLLRFYLGYEVQAHLQMEIASVLFPPAAMSSPQVRLGYSSYLPGVSPEGVVTNVKLGVYDGAFSIRD